MKPVNPENFAFGRHILAALVAEGLIPPTTSRLQITVDSESFVRVELEYCPERDKILKVIHATLLPDANE